MKDMRSLEEIKSEVKSLRDKEHALHAEAVGAMVLKFKDNKSLNALLSKVEKSKNLIQEHEWFSQYIHFDASKFIDTISDIEKDAFSEYLSEFLCIDVDYENSALRYNIGPCIVINNEDGDVLDQESGKWIIDRKDYETKEKLFELIEAYMEKSGYYPSVVSCDSYGNAFYVNTRGK
jgi:hypothetical protein